MSKPWIHHMNSSATSLSRFGLDRAIATVQSIAPLTSDHQRKDIPPIPKDMRQNNRKRPSSEQSLGGYEPNGKDFFYSHQNSSNEKMERPTMGSKSHSLPETICPSVSRYTHTFNTQPGGKNSERVLPPPPPPPMSKSAQKILQLTGFDTSGNSHMNVSLSPPPPLMSKSAQKILQLTGFDPSFDQESRSHYSVSPESSDADSSGSLYSQFDGEGQEYAQPRRLWAGPSTVIQGETSAAYVQSSFYSASERSAEISDASVAAAAALPASVTSLRFRDRPVKHDQRSVDLAGKQSKDIMTDEEFMAAKREYYQQKRTRFEEVFERDFGSRHGQELRDADKGGLVPRPLTIRSRPRVNDDNGKLRYYSEPASPTGLPYDGTTLHSRIPPRPQNLRHKRKFGTGKHPMKSPFPFIIKKEPGAEEPEQRFRHKVSRAMKRLSGGTKSPMTQSVSPSGEREAGEVDPPTPSGLKAFFPSQEIMQKGNEHLQDAVYKARKGLRIKTADERRREDLKKQIVVVGITDQSPGRPDLRVS
ncbi:hypothetical protein D0Z07_2596 [Hyphodiscus hymeniophilus]|uniref:Uncharacterized protein n=1 Tax=Hyphodiscus hymeniophilus TaxID=353542 RepID=A0A9P6VNA1_9HELO|nr:hypothetical protein D0Z07_2596 [Hyphodiscus hymeniophilus]